MPTIVVLPADLASQIAAGEVVERPASAVKELIENSIDAGATRCDIEIEGGGVTLLRVSDDGSGMGDEDARLSIQRHATSKLRSFADLSHVGSFGFRGEALPSIASVSRLRLQTRDRLSEAGIEVVVEGGGAPVVRPLGLAVGTTVEVRDLFYNVPARRKFMRSLGTESGHVTRVVEAVALGCPSITFTLTRDGRKVRELLRAPDRAERTRQLIPDVELAPCRGERGPLAVEAFVSRPEHAKNGAGGLEILVNRRSIHDRSIAVTIAQAYGSVLERGRYPRGVVYLDLPPELVDVNVHPQKAEVRFADPRAVTDALYSILSRALSSAFSLPVTRRGSWTARTPEAAPTAVEALEVRTESADPRPAAGATSTGDAATLPVDDNATSPAQTHAASPAQTYAFDERVLPTIAVRDSAAAPIRPAPQVSWSNLRFVAQLRQTFLVCEGDDGLYVLDQHAAAERVTFTRLRRAYQAQAVPSQALLFPVTFEASAAEVDLVERYAERIAEVGLDVHARGSDMISVHAIPKLLQQASPERLTRDLLSELGRTGGRAFSDAVDLALATMACHGSIRAGDAMSSSAATALLASLDGADFAGHCPHGRPVVTFTSWAELERRVGRR